MKENGSRAIKEQIGNYGIVSDHWSSFDHLRALRVLVVLGRWHSAFPSPGGAQGTPGGGTPCSGLGDKVASGTGGFS